jgi:predicted TPR repeat methyltransferase
MGCDFDDEQQNINDLSRCDISDQANVRFDRSIADRIKNIRILLLNKPNNARAMAKLACLIHSNETSVHLMLNSEAIDLAEKSIAVAPTKPYGYTAMSIVHPDFQVRNKALRMAIQQCADKDQFNLAAIDLQVRLLTEQRREKARTETRSNKVTNDERLIIKQLECTFHKVWRDPTIERNVESIEFIGLREYRLGRYFRKLEPCNVYRDMSIFYFEKAIEHLPRNHADHTMAQFWLATLVPVRNDASKPVFTKCPAEYIVGLYSTFAPKFDDLLVRKLEYETPKMLRSLHDRTILEPWNHPIQRRYRAIADLGCGTGLSGLAFASLLLNDGKGTGGMTGVDLSSEMLAFAERTHCYCNLVTGDVSSILVKAAAWDLVLACDVFCYIGDLSPVFGMVHASLMQNGIFVFSTEKLNDEYPVPFHLHECARFAHRMDYIIELAEKTGFETLIVQDAPIRKNKGKEVTGLLTILKKSQMLK